MIEHAAHPYTKLLFLQFSIHPDTQWKIPSVPQVTEEGGDARRFWQRCPHCKEQCKKNGQSLKKSMNIILLPAILLNKQHIKKEQPCKGCSFIYFVSIF